ncbi:MAG: hypothetical protein QMD94_04285, partial [Candidatus Omnitrophota bacterium]|nr:hypothetical protein [Candidatus Omnitrophota bacterium]
HRKNIQGVLSVDLNYPSNTIQQIEEVIKSLQGVKNKLEELSESYNENEFKQEDKNFMKVKLDVLFMIIRLSGRTIEKLGGLIKIAEDGDDAVSSAIQLVKLKNRAMEPEDVVMAAMLSLEQLRQHPKGFVLVHELRAKARDPQYKFFGDDTEAKLKKIKLIQSNGEIHESIRNVVLSAVVGDGLDIHLVSPLAEDGDDAVSFALTVSEVVNLLIHDGYPIYRATDGSCYYIDISKEKEGSSKLGDKQINFNKNTGSRIEGGLSWDFHYCFSLRDDINEDEGKSVLEFVCNTLKEEKVPSDLFDKIEEKINSSTYSAGSSISGSSSIPRKQKLGGIDSLASSLSIPKKQKIGGIDFRVMNIVTQPLIASSSLNLKLPQIPNLAAINLDEEFQQIQKMLIVGIIPSGERIKEFIAASALKGEWDIRVTDVISCLVEICRLEEDNVVETPLEIKEALVMADAMNLRG